MPCAAFKGHYDVALSTFTATKLNGPCLKEENKNPYTALMSFQAEIGLDSIGLHCRPLYMQSPTLEQQD